tara:strand:+ start:453 stop:1091 length:639 start_codon:yes stop_codon:yes gene_type:complete
LKIAIVGIELSQLVCAHTIFDQHPNVELHLISERAEAGLIGELPGLISQPLSNNIPNEWLGYLGSQMPTTPDTAVRRSWLEKALATKLVERGANLHLRTSINQNKSKLGETTISFAGAGYSSGSELSVEKVIIKPENNPSNRWRGGVHNEELTGSDYEGHRPDGLVEIWWPAEEEPPRSDGKWLQLMDWSGEDPSLSLEQEVELGRSLASIA